MFGLGKKETKDDNPRTSTDVLNDIIGVALMAKHMQDLLTQIYTMQPELQRVRKKYCQDRDVLDLELKIARATKTVLEATSHFHEIRKKAA